MSKHDKIVKDIVWNELKTLKLYKESRLHFIEFRLKRKTFKIVRLK